MNDLKFHPMAFSLVWETPKLTLPMPNPAPTVDVIYGFANSSPLVSGAGQAGRTVTVEATTSAKGGGL